MHWVVETTAGDSGWRLNFFNSGGVMHIVIVTHYYPPLNAIASFRPASFARYFAESGIDVTVLTTEKSIAEGSLDLSVFKHPRLTVHEIPYKKLQFWRKPSVESPAGNHVAQPVVPASSFKTILTRARRWGVACLGSLVDYQYFWTREAVHKFEEIHAQKPVDLLISSFGPPASHFIASSVIQKHRNIRWIADYRDLWSQRHIMTAKGIFKIVERYIEKRTVKSASHLTTVSQPLEAKLQELVNGKIPVSIVYNGYDSELDPSKFISGRMINQKMHIVYTGTIYEGRSDPSPLFQAIAELAAEDVITEEDITVSFYGNRMANLSQLVEKYKVSAWVELKGAVTHTESLLAQQNADFLLFLESNKPDARGVLTGKLFEYITTGKPILAVGVDAFCASAQVIRETDTGEVFSTDVIRIKNYLKQVWIDKRESLRSPKLDVIATYSRKQQSAKMMEIIGGLLPG